jgi:hypothetical protein
VTCPSSGLGLGLSLSLRLSITCAGAGLTKTQFTKINIPAGDDGGELDVSAVHM